MLSRESFKLSLYVTYTIQLLAICGAAFFSPLIATNISALIISQTIVHTLFGFYLLSLKNVKGWWAKQWFLAAKRVEFKKDLKGRMEKEYGATLEQLKGEKTR